MYTSTNTQQLKSLLTGRRRFLSTLINYRDIVLMLVAVVFIALAVADVHRSSMRVVANIALFIRLAWTSHLAKLVVIVFSRIIPVMLYLVCSR